MEINKWKFSLSKCDDHSFDDVFISEFMGKWDEGINDVDSVVLFIVNQLYRCRHSERSKYFNGFVDLLSKIIYQDSEKSCVVIKIALDLMISTHFELLDERVAFFEVLSRFVLKIFHNNLIVDFNSSQNIVSHLVLKLNSVCSLILVEKGIQLLQLIDHLLQLSQFRKNTPLSKPFISLFFAILSKMEALGRSGILQKALMSFSITKNTVFALDYVKFNIEDLLISTNAEESSIRHRKRKLLEENVYRADEDEVMAKDRGSDYQNELNFNSQLSEEGIFASKSRIMGYIYSNLCHMEIRKHIWEGCMDYFHQWIKERSGLLRKTWKQNNSAHYDNYKYWIHFPSSEVLACLSFHESPGPIILSFILAISQQNDLIWKYYTQKMLSLVLRRWERVATKCHSKRHHKLVDSIKILSPLEGLLILCCQHHADQVEVILQCLVDLGRILIDRWNDCIKKDIEFDFLVAIVLGSMNILLLFHWKDLKKLRLHDCSSANIHELFSEFLGIFHHCLENDAIISYFQYIHPILIITFFSFANYFGLLYSISESFAQSVIAVLNMSWTTWSQHRNADDFVQSNLECCNGALFVWLTFKDCFHPVSLVSFHGKLDYLTLISLWECRKSKLLKWLDRSTVSSDLTLNSLPSDIFYPVLEFLSIRNLGVFGSISNHFNYLIQNQRVWYEKYRQTFRNSCFESMMGSESQVWPILSFQECLCDDDYDCDACRLKCIRGTVDKKRHVVCDGSKSRHNWRLLFKVCSLQNFLFVLLS